MRKISVLLAVAGLAGCQSVPDSAAKLGVSFNFTAANRCSPVSPAITVTSAPGGTVKYSVHMTDVQVPAYNHGGGTVAATGTIPAGALKSFNGPCPPEGRHTYTISVKALDAAGKVLGAGSASRQFP